MSLCISLFFTGSLFSQKTVSLQYFLDGKAAPEFFPKIKDTLELSDHLIDWIQLQQAKGFLLAGLDSVVTQLDTMKVYMNKGDAYHWQFSDTQNDSLLSILSTEFFTTDLLDSTDYFTKLMKPVVKEYADRGYPFAQIVLQAARKSKDTFVIQVNLDKGKQIHFAQAQQADKPLFREYVFNRQIGIHPGSLFSHTLFLNSVDRIMKLNYVSLESKPLIVFPGDYCVARYYLKNEKSSKFDFLLGLNPVNGPNGKSYRLTGLGYFQLFNLMKMADELVIKYENLSNNAPKFLLHFKFPYLPAIPLGLEFDLGLSRFQENYFENRQQLSLTYPIDISSEIGLSIYNRSSDLLNADTAFVISTKRLPAVLDFTNFMIGFRLRHRNLDHTTIPTKGIYISAALHYGKKKFEPNPQLLAYDSEAVKLRQQYDSLNLNNRQAKFELHLESYSKFARRNVFKLALKSEGYLGGSFIPENEKYRLGGSQNLRGFDEDFYFTSIYALGSLEYRFLLDRQSFLSLFNDVGVLQMGTSDSKKWNVFHGLGMGIHFTTPIGLFSLQYAVGQGPGLSFDLGKGKIHFGYSVLF